MFLKLILVFCVHATVSLVIRSDNNVVTGKEFSYDSRLDLIDCSKTLNTTTMGCFKDHGYNGIVVRGYNPAGQGSYDNSSYKNEMWGYFGHESVSIYMTPQPFSMKSGANQTAEMYWGGTQNNVYLQSFWLQVTNPSTWLPSPTANVQFIQSIFDTAKQLGMTVGVYTNKADWASITGGWTGASNHSLWYSNVPGSGTNGETAPDFSDFRAFSGWTFAAAKQYAKQETVCGVTVNRSVFLID